MRTAEVNRHQAALRAEGLASSSAARAISAVRGLHRFAAREGLVGADVAAEVRPPTPPRRPTAPPPHAPDRAATPGRAA